VSEGFAPPPAPTGFFAPTKHLGSVIAVAPYKLELQVQHFSEVKDLIHCAIWIVLGDNAGAEYPSTKLSNAKLVSQLQPLIGKFTAGRLAEGQASASGKKPVVLQELTADELEAANNWLARGGKAKIAAALAAGARQAAAPPPTQGNGYAGGGMPAPPPVTSGYGNTPPF
jgi:hypothetical protein